ncbi:LapA family protein [Chitinimonas sp. JJ19]|uniref:LapA family protein n=1 Tax=Chitinimonas sp. JJ19 TaxID=3109352 RepID=UPI001A48F178|nr:LapA family protein [Chitinimonas sp.]
MPASLATSAKMTVYSKELSVRYLAWFIKIALFLFLFAFAIKNMAMVTLHGLLDMQWQAPLALVLFGAFVLGALAGVLAMLLQVARLKRELQQLKQHKESGVPAVTEPADRVEPSVPLDAVI